MSVKSNVLTILEERKGDSVSGEELAITIGVSRTAVWKAVKSLISDGHDVTATTNKGYVLHEKSNVLSVEGISRLLEKECDVFVYDTLVSTNDTAKIKAIEGAKEGTVVVAKEQIGGKGRRGRSFFSPNDSGIYMSVILTPDVTPEDSTLITTASALVTANAIEDLIQKPASIKWVNDIYVDGKKCVGILTEGVFDLDGGNNHKIIVGIGINLTTNNFPSDFAHRAGNIGEVSKNLLVAKIVNGLLKISSTLKDSKHLTEYKKKCFLLGKEVLVCGKEQFIAFARDIDEKGRLVVELADGSTMTLNNEEVSAKLNEYA